MLLSSRAAALVLSAGLAATAGAQTIPSYTVETRLVPLNTPVFGATILTMTLQARAVYSDPFPSDTTGPSARRYGNFGLISMGYGPAGAGQPSTITRNGAAHDLAYVSLRRGGWGTYHIEPGDGNPAYDWTPRGAAPGTQFAPSSPTFNRGFRFFNNASPLLDIPTGNGTPDDAANGLFDVSGNLTSLNLFRDDFSRPSMQQRNLVDADGGPAWQDVYRFDIVDARGLVYLGSVSEDDAAFSIRFDGWFRAAGVSGLIGNSWFLAGGDLVRSTSVVNFGSPLLPAPGPTAALVVASFVAARRKRC